MKRIEKCLDDLGIKYEIKDNEALVEFWTDTADQDIPTEFDFDGTPENFVARFTECAENYDVDDEVELYVNMRGKTVSQIQSESFLTTVRKQRIL